LRERRRRRTSVATPTITADSTMIVPIVIS
jgi:hypothetical protein